MVGKDLSIPDGWTFFDYVNQQLSAMSGAISHFQSYLDDWESLDQDTKNFIKNKTIQTFAASLVSMDEIKRYMETIV